MRKTYGRFSMHLCPKKIRKVAEERIGKSFLNMFSETKRVHNYVSSPIIVENVSSAFNDYSKVTLARDFPRMCEIASGTDTLVPSPGSRK